MTPIHDTSRQCCDARCTQGRDCPLMRAKPEPPPAPVGSQFGPVERYFVMLGIALAGGLIWALLQ